MRLINLAQDGKGEMMFDKVLSLWTGMTPWTKRIIFIVFGVIIIAAMVTGNFDSLLGLVKD